MSISDGACDGSAPDPRHCRRKRGRRAAHRSLIVFRKKASCIGHGRLREGDGDWAFVVGGLYGIGNGGEIGRQIARPEVRPCARDQPNLDFGPRFLRRYLEKRSRRGDRRFDRAQHDDLAASLDGFRGKRGIRPDDRRCCAGGDLGCCRAERRAVEHDGIGFPGQVPKESRRFGRNLLGQSSGLFGGEKKVGTNMMTQHAIGQPERLRGSLIDGDVAFGGVQAGDRHGHSSAWQKIREPSRRSPLCRHFGTVSGHLSRLRGMQQDKLLSRCYTCLKNRAIFAPGRNFFGMSAVALPGDRSYVPVTCRPQFSAKRRYDHGFRIACTSLRLRRSFALHVARDARISPRQAPQGLCRQRQ
ncbi:hypothetical protein RHSP_33437 [Rhizobium freirei PRF 81]|uniref:Uncharacterized protein n=1 Tax=Rhizobium freirei PRF 81 TaxID=363754 RepID=N6UWX6_9HYPH|nr:hypothetical protein RHSP_33437 [Rhizobium freirei PRF 81]